LTSSRGSCSEVLLLYVLVIHTHTHAHTHTHKKRGRTALYIAGHKSDCQNVRWPFPLVGFLRKCRGAERSSSCTMETCFAERYEKMEVFGKRGVHESMGFGR